MMLYAGQFGSVILLTHNDIGSMMVKVTLGMVGRFEAMMSRLRLNTDKNK